MHCYLDIKCLLQAVNYTVGFKTLYRVAEAGKLEILKIILGTQSGKATISTCDNNGRNVFHCAVKHPVVVKHLLTVSQNVTYKESTNGPKSI